MLFVLLVNGDYDQRQQQLSKPSPAPIRPSNIFHGNPAYPTPPNPYAASMPPQLSNGIEQLPAHTTVSASATMDHKNEELSPSPESKPEHPSLPGKPPEVRQSKYFNVEDPERSNHKVRVRLALHDCPIHEVPDDFRKRHSVYPRSWYPAQIQLSPSSRAPRGRFLHERGEDAEEEAAKDEDVVGTTLVQVPMLEGREGDLKVPGLGRQARNKEEQLNEMGYRISWNQRKLFADRVLFLQQSLDVYRARIWDGVNKGQEVKTAARVYETRVGKKKWVESKGRAGRGKGARE